MVKRSMNNRDVVIYAVYVWDTREVIAAGGVAFQRGFAVAKRYADVTAHSVRAVDNHAPLVGDGSIVRELNDEMQKSANKSTTAKSGPAKPANSKTKPTDDDIAFIVNRVKVWMRNPTVDGAAATTMKDARSVRRYCSPEDQRMIDKALDMYRDM